MIENDQKPSRFQSFFIIFDQIFSQFSFAHSFRHTFQFKSQLGFHSFQEVLRIVDIVLEVFGNGKPDMSIPLVDLVSVFKWRFRPDLFDKYGTSYKLNTTNEWDDLNGLTKMLDDHIFVYPTEQIITALLRNTSSIYYSR